MVANLDYWCGVCISPRLRLLSNGVACPMCRLMRQLPKEAAMGPKWLTHQAAVSMLSKRDLRGTDDR